MHSPAAMLVASALLTATLGCASRPASVRVIAERGELAPLAGAWSGEYRSAATGRSGSIVFRLSAAGDSAYGDVVMVPRGADEPLHPAQAPSAPASRRRSPQVLAISFVRVSHDSVSGRLEPYHEPECDCTLSTNFTGLVTGNAIEGTFATTGAPTATSPQTGTWRVRRTSAPK